MIFIEHSPCEDPAINLALEEHCFTHLDPTREILLTYVNRPSVVIGRHQNAFDQVNLRVAREKGIPVIRRRSGGGAVYHDCGNLNFSFIGRFDRSLFLNYRRMLSPVIHALSDLGIPATFSAPNQIVVENYKVSGNSQYSNMKRMVSHGTLLYETDLDTLETVLTPELEIVHSRGIRSEPRPVVNLSGYFGSAPTFVQFRQQFTHRLADGFGGKTPLRLAPSDWEEIHDLARRKYQRWEWNYGRSPEFTSVFPWNNSRVHIDVAKGVVRLVRDADDTLSSTALSRIREDVIGRRFSDVNLEKMKCVRD